MEYFFSKSFDNLGNKLASKFCKKDLSELFKDIYGCFCQKNGWEFNIDEVYKLLKNKTISFDKLNDENYVNSFLQEVLGSDFRENYKVNFKDQWNKCLQDCITEPKYEKLYKAFEFDKIVNIENKIENYEKKEADWRKREISQREKNSEIITENGTDNTSDQKHEFEIAIKAMEAEEFEEAIKGFTKVSIWSNDEQKKYICLYYKAYCYSKLAKNADGYNLALKYFQKAEKHLNILRDDAVLLYRNIGLVYTYIGEIKEKVFNYKKANEYFEKALLYANEKDEYFVIDVNLHVARNYMDISDEVPMSEVLDNLSLAMVKMMAIDLLAGDVISEEHDFILSHNMGRVFFHLAEKENKPQCYIKARELYFKVLKMDIVRRDRERLAMVNVNLGMTYYRDYPKDALIYYQRAYDIYKGLDNFTCNNKMLNLQFDMAEAYSKLYFQTKNEEKFQKSENLLLQIVEMVDAMPYNSLYLRIYLSLMKLYYRRIVVSDDKTERNKWIKKADEVSDNIASILVSTDFEKYKYTYFILKYDLDLFKIDAKTDISSLINIKNELQKIANEAKIGNINLYQKALETISEYDEAIQWRLGKQDNV
jgi:tetratricopeptide (TPR) repeat protein